MRLRAILFIKYILHLFHYLVVIYIIQHLANQKNININNHNKQIMNSLKIVLIGTNFRALLEVDQLWLVCPGGSSLKLGSFKLSEFQLMLDRKIYIV